MDFLLQEWCIYLVKTYKIIMFYLVMTINYRLGPWTNWSTIGINSPRGEPHQNIIAQKAGQPNWSRRDTGYGFSPQTLKTYRYIVVFVN